MTALLVPFAFPLGAFAYELAGDRAVDDGFGTYVAAVALLTTLFVAIVNPRRRTPHDLLFGTAVAMTRIVRRAEPADGVTPRPFHAGVEPASAATSPSNSRDPLPAAVPLGYRRIVLSDVLLVALLAATRTWQGLDHLRW